MESKTKTTTSRRARRHKRIVCPEITAYLRLVETGRVEACEEQRLFCAYVRHVFATEELYIDRERLARYAKKLEYFPFDELFPWEWCVFTLFTCVFKKDGTPRWTDLVCFIGRGSGKNGLIAFIAFCMITNINGIEGYDVDICANSEEQAKRSFDDVWLVLESRYAFFKRHFSWSKTYITSRSTSSTIRYRTNSPKSKDGMRSGIVIFDEVHEYKDYKNIKVFTTGLGKHPHPRRAFISSNGDVRDGVYDKMLARCQAILRGEKDDNGYLPFVCKLDDETEVHDERMWEKATPSIRYMPDLKTEIAKEYADWLEDPIAEADFMTKRMGLLQGNRENEVTSWENIVAACGEVPDLSGRTCVAGIDYASLDDFASAVLLFREDGHYYARHHSWLCATSRHRSRISAPLEQWEKDGILDIVHEPEISPRVLVDWIAEQMGTYDVRGVAIDDFRYALVMRELRDIGFSVDDKNLVKVRPSNHAKVQPVINSAFATGRISWGDDPAMRWFTNNTKLAPFSNGNYKYEKIEPKGRKTDGFMAMVAAFCIEDMIPQDAFDDVLDPLVF